MIEWLQAGEGGYLFLSKKREMKKKRLHSTSQGRKEGCLSTKVERKSYRTHISAGKTSNGSKILRLGCSDGSNRK